MYHTTKLTVFSRKKLVMDMLGGKKVASLARAMGVSRKCCYKWLRRYKAEGDAGLQDRPKWWTKADLRKSHERTDADA